MKSRKSANLPFVTWNIGPATASQLLPVTDPRLGLTTAAPVSRPLSQCRHMPSRLGQAGPAGHCNNMLNSNILTSTFILGRGGMAALPDKAGMEISG
jgi:hypothetical protein